MSKMLRMLKLPRRLRRSPRLPKNNPQALPPLPGGSLRTRALGSGDDRNIDGIGIQHRS
jgi:hypothetical protein